MVTKSDSTKCQIFLHDNTVINCVYEGEYLTSFDYEYVHYDDSYAKVIKEKCIMTVEQKDFDEFTIDLPDFTNWEQIKQISNSVLVKNMQINTDKIKLFIEWLITYVRINMK